MQKFSRREYFKLEQCKMGNNWTSQYIRNGGKAHINILLKIIFFGTFFSCFFNFVKVLNMEEEICTMKKTSIHLIPIKNTFKPWTQIMCRLDK